MRKNIQFVIENKNLYLEKILVKTSVPVFFICKDILGVRYSVLCTDTSGFKYTIVQSYNEDIKDLLDMKISVRELINRAIGDVCWEVEISKEDGSDIVTKRSIINIPNEYLPEDNSVCITEDFEYIKQINFDVGHNKFNILLFKILTCLNFLMSILFITDYNSNMFYTIILALCNGYVCNRILKLITIGGKK